jgi:hypothetical protein
MRREDYLQYTIVRTVPSSHAPVKFVQGADVEVILRLMATEKLEIAPKSLVAKDDDGLTSLAKWTRQNIHAYRIDTEGDGLSIYVADYRQPNGQGDIDIGVKVTLCSDAAHKRILPSIQSKLAELYTPRVKLK